MLSPKEHRKLERYIDGLDVSRMAEVFDALSEPNRCLIFRALLKTNNVSVGQLAEVVGISQSLASQHLTVLKQADLVGKQKNGRTVYYHVNEHDALVRAIGRAVDD